MLFTDIIRKKRDGGALTAAEIGVFTAGLVDDSIADEQIAALAMAICVRSMTPAETGLLTRSMAQSGTVLRWRDCGPVVDKHSTGGVGDKVSLMLAPIAAACGCLVPMISGRGLGHTGGTLDKLESIPGYNVTPDPQRFDRIVRDIRCAIIGQTAALAPADKRLYAIRDVTGTIESVPLITASILSKKIAAGVEALALDVKVGNGAFMTSLDEARALARSIVKTGALTGLNTRALITDMNEPLGTSVGNALEVAEAIAYLGNVYRAPRIDEITLTLVAQMLVMSGLDNDMDSARARADQAVTSGRAAQKFGQMVAALGGPTDLMERPAQYLPTAPVQMPVCSTAAGYLGHINTRAVGDALIELGGGRHRANERLDLSVGFSAVAAIGTALERGQPLAVVHAASEVDAQMAATQLHQAMRIQAQPPAARPVVYEVISGDENAA